MEVPLLDLRRQYQSLKSEIEPAVLSLMESQLFVLGPKVAAFEENIARYHDCPHAVGVSSGTDALLVSLMAMGIGPGDEVIVPTFTFFGSAGAIARTGAQPVFVDIRADTFNIDPDRAAVAITSKTRAVMPVHLFGQMADMEALSVLARQHDLYIIEDACQSIGARRNGKAVGTLGDTACLSFYPSKNLAAFGDAGLVLCRDGQLAQKIRHLRMHGEDRRYYHSMIGGNFRLDALQALVLDIKLKYLDQWAARRQAHAALYNELLREPVIKPVIDPANTSVFNQYVIRVPRRDQLQRSLSENGIGSAVYYPVPLHLQACFSYLYGQAGDCPVAEQACSEVLALPVYPELSDEQIEFVARTINRFFAGT